MPHQPTGGSPFTARELAASRRAIRELRTAMSGVGFREGFLRAARTPLRVVPIESLLDLTAFIQSARFPRSARAQARAAEQLKREHRRFLRGRGPATF